MQPIGIGKSGRRFLPKANTSTRLSKGSYFGIELTERTMFSIGGVERAPVRLLLVDDDERVLDQMSLLLSERFEIAGVAHDGKQMIAEAERLRPDVIVADVTMPHLDGIEAARLVLSRYPRVLIVMFTMHREPDVVQRALEAGARGYVYKLQGLDDVISAIHSVLHGQIFVSSSCMNSR